MGFEAVSFESKKRGHTILLRAQAFFKVTEYAIHHERPEFAHPATRSDLSFNLFYEKLVERFGCFEEDVTHKTIGHNHIDLAAIHLKTLD